MKIRILPSATTAVAILATATTSVGGFSTNAPALSGGCRTGNSYGRLVGNGGSTCQRMPTVRLQNQMFEPSRGEADDSETAVEKEGVTIVDQAEEAETTTKKEDDLVKVRQLLAMDVATDDADEVEEVVDIDGAEEEEETKEEDGDVDESETAAVAIDESEKIKKEEDKTEDKVTTSDSIASPMFFAVADDEATNQEKDESKNESDPKVQGLNLETVKKVAGKIAVDAFSVLRFTAANVLTKSLPDEQRIDLLGRLGANPADIKSAAAAAAAKKMSNQKLQQERNSIQEEIAAARLEESQKSESKWKREKEEILLQMEAAASARVKNELKIQEMKLEEETAKALKEKETAMEAERERLEQAIQKEAKRVEALEAKVEEDANAKEEEEKIEVEDSFAVGTDEEEARNKELDALLNKRQEDQAVLEAVEKELLASISNEEKQRDLLDSMLEKRQVQQEKLDTVEASLRAQIEEVDEEKARYQKLVADLETMKNQEWKPEDQQLSEDSSEEADEETDADSKESEEDMVNPVLGPVIADLGYKRIHFVSAGRLGTIPVWNRNRTYRNNRAKGMAIEKAKTMELGFPGAICLHEAPNGKLSILDGQHRVGMMAALKQTVNKKNKNEKDIPGALKDVDGIFERILVEVYPEPGNEGDETVKRNGRFAEQVFLEINKAEPVKLIDMPGVASKVDRQIITEGVYALKEEYKNMFSPSQRCRTPNVNEDNLRGMVFGANILKRHKITTSKKLMEWLLKQNKVIGEEYKEDASKQELVSKKQWIKASENKFYLGLESSWLYK